MTVLLQNATVGMVSAIIEDASSTQFVLEANMGTGGSLGWEVSNITPYVQLNSDGSTRTLQGFIPADADFVRVKTPSTSGIFYLNGNFRYMRVRVLTGSPTYVALKAYSTGTAFPGTYLDTSDVETVFLSYQMPDFASVAAYTGRSKVLWITTGALRGEYVRDDASGAVPNITGSAGQKWFKVSI